MANEKIANKYLGHCAYRDSEKTSPHSVVTVIKYTLSVCISASVQDLITFAPSNQ